MYILQRMVSSPVHSSFRFPPIVCDLQWLFDINVILFIKFSRDRLILHCSIPSFSSIIGTSHPYSNPALVPIPIEVCIQFTGVFPKPMTSCVYLSSVELFGFMLDSQAKASIPPFNFVHNSYNKFMSILLLEFQIVVISSWHLLFVVISNI